MWITKTIKATERYKRKAGYHLSLDIWQFIASILALSTGMFMSKMSTSLFLWVSIFLYSSSEHILTGRLYSKLHKHGGLFISHTSRLINCQTYTGVPQKVSHIVSQLIMSFFNKDMVYVMCFSVTKNHRDEQSNINHSSEAYTAGAAFVVTFVKCLLAISCVVIVSDGNCITLSVVYKGKDCC